ncbi:hypothetical protein C7C46_26505 [Streptomyces tateyamensis]|uniref:Uncharacterized protein n=1 Tax=Streptomyces tateyamensis TaxID=565073 RepID=A0A2V4MVZ0_9ACTN|nr:hypothetical protein [Streptomyces tateyamensis]PYC71902.1 hypothetical protein C7C46_26505 [Streptomyces tateyamensis]
MRQHASVRILAPLFLVLAPVAGVLASAELTHATAPAAVQDRADVGWNNTPVGGTSTPAPTPTPTA